jgi:hypothetical protein
MTTDPVQSGNAQMPSLSAAKALLGTKTAWMPLDSVTDYDGPGVYFLRTTDNLPIQRWKGTDGMGLLYIGMAGRSKGNMNKRSRQLADGTHQVIKRLMILVRVCPGMKGAMPACRYCFIRFNSESEARFWESYFLFSYHRHFADRPPFNRQLEQDIIHSHGWGASDHTLPWPEVSDLLA